MANTHTNLDTILSLLLYTEAVPRDVLRLSGPTDRSSTKVIAQARSEGYINEKKILNEASTDRKHITLSYYTLTRKGLAYITGSPNFTLKTEYASLDISDVSLKTPVLRSESKRRRHFKLARAALMSWYAGATVEFPLYAPGYDDEEGGEGSIRFLLSQAIAVYNNEHEKRFSEINPHSQPDERLFYFDSIRMKRLISGKSDKSGLNDVRRGSFTGIIQSPERALPIYVASEFGIKWQYAEVVKDIGIINTFEIKLSSQGTSTPSPGNAITDCILMVRNPEHFSMCYFGDYVKQNKNTRLGDGYTHMYVIPVTREGVAQLRRLIMPTADKYNTQLVSKALSSGIFQENTSGFNSDFPLLDQSGELVGNGVNLDVRQIRRWIEISKRMGRLFSIICFDWQLDYYEVVCPDSKLYTVT